MKFRKKPVVIEAVQWFPGINLDGLKVVPAHDIPSRAGGVAYTEPEAVWCDTLEGLLRVSPGDWIVTGIKGEHYPVRPDIFEATYEPVGERAEGEK